jgi:hypothetical protein
MVRSAKRGWRVGGESEADMIAILQCFRHHSDSHRVLVRFYECPYAMGITCGDVFLHETVVGRRRRGVMVAVAVAVAILC